MLRIAISNHRYFPWLASATVNISAINHARTHIHHLGFAQHFNDKSNYSTTLIRVHRNQDYKILSNADVDYFKSILTSPAQLSQDPDILNIHNHDWTRRFSGSSSLVLFPSNTSQVSKILSYCNANKLAVTPQAGNTGLVGGSVPVFDEIILNTSKLNKIIHFDPVSSVLTCEAGCILQSLDDYLQKNYSYCIPLDLGAKGSCQIGGNIATNAGGLRFLKYGSLHGSVLGLEVVLADGKILDLMSTLRKDNTGYDLKQLFIGSEGSLGVITKVAISSPKHPSMRHCMLLAVRSFNSIQSILSLARERLSDILSAFEFWDTESAEIVYHYHPDFKQTFNNMKESFFVLIETSSFADTESVSIRLSEFLESCLSTNDVSDGILSLSESQLNQFWKFREIIPEACTKYGHTIFKYDVSVPTPTLYSLVPLMRDRLLPEFPDTKIVGYGHAGDGNLHLNIMTPDKPSEKFESLLEPFIFEQVQKLEGSVSAEHGLGLQKCHKIYYSKSDLAVSYMQQIKQLFDPNYILNPYKVIPHARR